MYIAPDTSNNAHFAFDIVFKEYDDESDKIMESHSFNNVKFKLKCNYDWPVDFITYDEFRGKSSGQDVHLIKNNYKNMIRNLSDGIEISQSNLQVIRLKDGTNNNQYLLWIINDDDGDISAFFYKGFSYVSFSKEGELIGLIII